MNMSVAATSRAAPIPTWTLPLGPDRDHAGAEPCPEHGGGMRLTSVTTSTAHDGRVDERLYDRWQRVTGIQRARDDAVRDQAKDAENAVVVAKYRCRACRRNS